MGHVDSGVTERKYVHLFNRVRTDGNNWRGAAIAGAGAGCTARLRLAWCPVTPDTNRFLSAKAHYPPAGQRFTLKA